MKNLDLTHQNKFFAIYSKYILLCYLGIFADVLCAKFPVQSSVTVSILVPRFSTKFFHYFSNKVITYLFLQSLLPCPHPTFGYKTNFSRFGVDPVDKKLLRYIMWWCTSIMWSYGDGNVFAWFWFFRCPSLSNEHYTSSVLWYTVW